MALEESQRRERLEERLAALERLLHGKKSEKRKAVKVPPPLPKEPVTRAQYRVGQNGFEATRNDSRKRPLEEHPLWRYRPGT